jgi:hypothetical protein
MTPSLPPKRPAIWWENIIFFCATHLAAAYGVYHRPPATVPMPILVATVALWQLSSLGCAYSYLTSSTPHDSMEYPDIALLLDTTAYFLIALSVRRLAYGSSLQ